MRIMEALAQIAGAKDFRLKEIMAKVGLDPTQPALFYRGLVREAREVVPLLARREKEAAAKDARLSRLEKEVAELRRKVQALEPAAFHMGSATAYAAEIKGRLDEAEARVASGEAGLRAAKEGREQAELQSLLLSWIVLHTFTNFQAVKLEPQHDGSAHWLICQSPIYVTITVSPQGQISLRFTEPPSFFLAGEDYASHLRRSLHEAASRIEFIFDET